MNERQIDNGKPLPGYRLMRVELLNWGTFDSTHGHVHVLPVHGETALVIGQNGSGKSTLVDALLTLLVRPVVRNYNVAAGTDRNKRERDERSYIKGAFGRFSRDEDNRAAVQFLRPRVTQPSVLLASFSNQKTGKAFTVAQLLYLDSEGGKKQIYCFAPNERSITGDFGKPMDKSCWSSAAAAAGSPTLNSIAGCCTSGRSWRSRLGFDAVRRIEQSYRFKKARDGFRLVHRSILHVLAANQ